MSARHPQISELALFAGGELNILQYLTIRLHTARCGACRQEIAHFKKASEWVRTHALTEPIPAFDDDWKRLEREMVGNIGVGVAAARCIENVGRRRAWMRSGWLVAGLAILFAIGWFSHVPLEDNQRLFAAFRRISAPRHIVRATELRSTSDGIAVQTPAATLTLIHPSSAVVSAAGPSAVAARFVDEETGQVTITKVYGQ